MQWTEDVLAQAIKLYQDKMEEFSEDEKPLRSMEVVKEVADEIGATTNGVRMKLSGAGVYIKSKKAVAKPASGADGAKPKRVNKAEAIAELINIIEANGVVVADEQKEIMEKLTGKAAVMFTELFAAVAFEKE